MNVCGIVAEYNPFHNGHLYHLQQAIQTANADYTVVVMSGNFVQRGTPALMDKYTRAQAALKCGADLVLELPVCYACGSAEYFAGGAVSLLDKLGAVTHLCFGSECGDISLLSGGAEILANEPEYYRETLRAKVKSGLSFPAARTETLLSLYPELSPILPQLSSPNNILGLEYMKALLRRNSAIRPLTVTRTGSSYHDSAINGQMSSATAIRQALCQGSSLDDLSHQIPAQALEIFNQYFAHNTVISPDDLSIPLHYKLISEQYSGYSSYMDVSEDLSDRIRRSLHRFTSFSQFCDQLKTKELTLSRISRCMLHILLNITKDEVNQYINNGDYTVYARILGFRQNALPLLGEISQKASIPLVSKLADADRILDESALHMLKQDICRNDIYASLLASKKRTAMKNEYQTPIIILRD